VSAESAHATNAHRASRKIEIASGIRATGPLNGIPIPQHALTTITLLNLQRAAGNQAVSAYLKPVQRKPLDKGWTHASTEGRAWNKGQREVGDIHRIPLEGLAAGMQTDKAKRFGKDEPTSIPELSSESAVGEASEPARGKAIVLVPKKIDAKAALNDASAKIDVIFFLHGHTEDSGDRPYAGWRELNPKAGKPPRSTEEEDIFVHSLRHGLKDVPPAPGVSPGTPKEPADTAPVRDVALDQAEQQLQESGTTQTIMVLPQGGLHSQFGTAGDTDFNADAYYKEVISRLEQIKVLDTGESPEKIVGRVSMAGHSGAGATLSRMAGEAVRRDRVAKAIAAGKRIRKEDRDPLASSVVTGDLVIFDAINKGQLGAFQDWALLRLKTDLEALEGFKTDTAKKLKYLRGAPKLRGYYSTDVKHKGRFGGSYANNYKELQRTIDEWFKANAAGVGPVVACWHANYVVNIAVPVAHEELMRGVSAEADRGKGEGSILDALKALHRNTLDVDSCPPLPDAAKPSQHTKRHPRKDHSTSSLEEEKKLVHAGR